MTDDTKSDKDMQESILKKRKKPPHPIPIQGNYKIRRDLKYKVTTVTAWARI